MSVERAIASITYNDARRPTISTLLLTAGLPLVEIPANQDDR
jgi:hypothetical protein